MTVSELQLEIERGLWDDSTSLAQIERVQLRLYDLIADWKLMHAALVIYAATIGIEDESIGDESKPPNADFSGPARAALRTLRLKP